MANLYLQREFTMTYIVYIKPVICSPAEQALLGLANHFFPRSAKYKRGNARAEEARQKNWLPRLNTACYAR